MPFRRRTFRKRRPVIRRRARKIRTYGKSYRRVPRPVAVGVSKYRFAKLSYCDLCTGTVNTNDSLTFAYQSSLYDPYVATGGHQPMFFDQYASMYQRYTVMGIAYNLDITTDQFSTGPLFVTVTPSSVGASPTTLSIARERPGARETACALGYRGRLKGYISVAKLLGVDRRKLLTDDQYSALITADPSQMAFMTIQAWNTSATAGIICYISLRLTYYCRFFDPTDPSQS